MYADQRKIAHWFQKDGDGTYVLTECAIISQSERQQYPDEIIYNIPYDKRPKYKFLNGANMSEKIVPSQITNISNLLLSNSLVDATVSTKLQKRRTFYITDTLYIMRGGVSRSGGTIQNLR